MATVNPSRHYAREFARRAAAQGTDKTFRVLDAGAGNAPYADLFGHVSLEMADVCLTPGKDYSHIDLVCDVVDIPVEDGRYDLVWCSQTLEHVREPMTALREFHRILKPGGEAWLTAPFYYAEHEVPWDFYRFSRYAWRYFADELGYEVVEIEPLEGYYGMLAYTFDTASRQLPEEMTKRRQQLRRMAREFAELDLTDKRTDIGMCKNYQVILRKPDDSPVI
ncbi:class I SAM-dependent methyltransferase [Nocardioides sp.]|uniref:class I SAM-dependent methyltransferase n=1 Tax=Nocardioides sp. TaxID=35761 RepID=UPI003D0F994E